MKQNATASYSTAFASGWPAGLRTSIRRLTLCAMLMLEFILTPQTHGQGLRVSSYDYEADTIGDFHTFVSIHYTFGVGQTGIGNTNVTDGVLENPNIIAFYSTNTCGWDTNTGSLSKVRDYVQKKEKDDGTYTGERTFSEDWSGDGPSFPSGFPAISYPGHTSSVGLKYLTGGSTNNPQSRLYEITVFETRESGQAVPASEAKVNGTNCDSEGRVYVSWDDCTNNTVVFSFPTTRTNVYYNVSVGMVRPQIFLVTATWELDDNGNTTAVFETNRVTDATNSVLAVH